MAGYVASKAVGVVREPLIARTFGAGEQLDAYYAAFNVPDLLFTLIAGGRSRRWAETMRLSKHTAMR